MQLRSNLWQIVLGDVAQRDPELFRVAHQLANDLVRPTKGHVFADKMLG